MNTIDLNAYGISEMTKQEMKDTNGGSLTVFLIGAGIGLVAGTIAFFVARDREAEQAADQLA